MLGTASFGAEGDQTGGPDGPAPTLAAVRVAAPPTIDGVLDDECWRLADKRSGFYLFGREGSISEDTSAYLCYDEHSIYVAFDCADAHPDLINAAQRKRGSDLSSEDNVEFWVDPTGQHRDWYVFQVSPLGTQGHSVPGGSASKAEWKGDWSAAARVTDAGWQAEMAIPFSILTYPAGAGSFYVAFSRHLARERERSVWPFIAPGSWRPDRPAAWTGLVIPHPRRPMVAMPYALARLGDDDSGATVGLDVKTTFANGVTALLTLRPDFRNIEQDVESIDFSYTERLLPDNRPFFMDGMYRYFPRSQLFYTRRIEELDAGFKTFGKIGRHRFGFLAAGENGQSDVEVAHYAYERDADSRVWVDAVNYSSADQLHNLATGVGMRWRRAKPGGDVSIHADLMHSSTSGEGEDGAAYRIHGGRDRGDGHVSWSLSATGIGSGFEPALGYEPEPGLHEVGGGAYYSRRLDTGPYWRKSWHAFVESATTTDDSRFGVNLGGALYRRNDTSTEARVHIGKREGYPDRTLTLNFAWNDRNLYRYAGLTASFGEKAGGTYRYLGVTKNFRPSAYFSSLLAVEFLDHAAVEEPAEEHQIVAQATYDFEPEKSVSARVVAHNGDLNVFVAYRRVVRAGLDTYVLFGDPNAETTQSTVTVKLVSAFMF